MFPNESEPELVAFAISDATDGHVRLASLDPIRTNPNEFPVAVSLLMKSRDEQVIRYIDQALKDHRIGTDAAQPDAVFQRRVAIECHALEFLRNHASDDSAVREGLQEFRQIRELSNTAQVNSAGLVQLSDSKFPEVRAAAIEPFLLDPIEHQSVLPSLLSSRHSDIQQAAERVLSLYTASSKGNHGKIVE